MVRPMAEEDRAGFSSKTNTIKLIMELEIKHLSPYLPYDLQCIGYGRKLRLNGQMLGAVDRLIVKPILRPLSDLTKSELIQLRFDEGNDTLLWAANNIEAYDCFIQFYETDLTYSVLEWAYKKHLDVFGLIDAGLAIDINTI